MFWLGHNGLQAGPHYIGCRVHIYLPGGRLEISHKGFARGLALIVIISAKPQPTWINNSTRYTPVTGS